MSHEQPAGAGWLGGVSLRVRSWWCRARFPCAEGFAAGQGKVAGGIGQGRGSGADLMPVAGLESDGACNSSRRRRSSRSLLANRPSFRFTARPDRYV